MMDTLKIPNMTSSPNPQATNLKNKTVCVIDNGLFVSFARKIAPAFKKVYYHTPFASAFPRSHQLTVGDGFDELEHCKFPLHHVDEVDLWVFTDLYHCDLQLYLESHGARVWGARNGEEMELYRWEFKQYLKRIGLPVQPMEHIIGFDALRQHLKKVKNKYVKTSFVRGDFETFRHDTYELSEPRIDDLEHSLGALKHGYEFIVEDEIPDAVEVGYDGFTVDGEFPTHAMQAYEVKDCGMIGMSLPYAKLSEPVRVVNKALVPALKGYTYRGFLSTEIRYTKDKRPYFIDPCCRLGTPSNELLQELFDGWAEVLWHGAEGKLHSPTVKQKFSVGAVIKSEYAVNDWMCLHYPKELDSFVKLRFHSRIDSKDYVAPQVIGLPDVGMVVGSGDTLLAAIRQCKERASQIKGFQVEVSLESIGKAIETIKEGEKRGIMFGDSPIPTAEQVAKC
jgi:hypothetical protein